MQHIENTKSARAEHHHKLGVMLNPNGKHDINSVSLNLICILDWYYKSDIIFHKPILCHILGFSMQAALAVSLPLQEQNQQDSQRTLSLRLLLPNLKLFLDTQLPFKTPKILYREVSLVNSTDPFIKDTR